MKPPKPPLLLEAQTLDWSVDQKPLVRGVSLDLRAGEMLGLIGPNGAGKSSLLSLLANLRSPDRGQRRLMDRDYRHFSITALATRLGYLPQNPPLHWPLTVETVVGLGRLPYQGLWRRSSEQDRRAIDAALIRTAIKHLAQRSADSLSAGEKMLVQIARLLAAEPAVLLVDEPTTALDPRHQLLMMDTLREHTLSGDEHGVIVVLHDLSLAARFCDRLLLLHQGRVVAEGKPGQVLSRENLKRYYGVDAWLQQGDHAPHVLMHGRSPENGTENSVGSGAGIGAENSPANSADTAAETGTETSSLG
jgi:iron complex transport system ATP-binding protein